MLNLFPNKNKKPQTILYKMIRFIWTINSLALIFAIIIHSPKSQGMGGQNQLFGSTRSAEASLNKITWLLISTFFFLTVYLAISNTLE
jgi:preprotein translocase subunit SecG